jgi:acyl dehydratase
MAVTEPEAVMPQAVITDEMIASMTAKAGAVLRIDHSVNNELASRIAVTKFAGGIGDINPLWTDQDYARDSPYGAPVAPPSFIIGCFPAPSSAGHASGRFTRSRT